MNDGAAAAVDEPAALPTARVIRAAECRRMPWKNGGGATTEICVHPPGAGLIDFGWRVSMATVASDGPFSAFPGIDRTLTVLDGDGLRLTIGAAAPVDLTPLSAPLAFAADAPTHATLIGLPVTDLNVMTRRGAWHHAVTRWAPEGESPAGAGPRTRAPTLLWLCHRGMVDIAGPGVAVRLGPLDAWVVENMKPTDWCVSGPADAELFLIELETLPAPHHPAQGTHAAVEFEE
jgi:hypothetical protein